MSVYALLWQLIKHVLHGRGRDEVCVSIEWDLPDRQGAVTGIAKDFTWVGDEDAFCSIDAVSEDGPWSDFLITPGASS